MKRMNETSEIQWMTPKTPKSTFPAVILALDTEGVEVQKSSLTLIPSDLKNAVNNCISLNVQSFMLSV